MAILLAAVGLMLILFVLTALAVVKVGKGGLPNRQEGTA